MIWKKSGNLIMIRFEDGEKFFEKLKEVIKETKIGGSIIVSCVGQLKDVEIAYYSKEERKYYTKILKEVFEVLNMSGNISFYDNEIVIHAHVTLGNKNFSCIGGHLNEAIVNSTLELFLIETPVKLEKIVDKNTGLKILNFKSQ
jgi:predicted DNA-binding protein with PD1-like motif